jgi:hypothetical protein
VQRALDLATVEPAIGQPGIRMGADVVGGEDLAIEVVDRDIVSRDKHAEDIALGKIAPIGRLDPPGVVAHPYLVPDCITL